MTELLQKAFDLASHLPEALQDQLACEVLEEIKSELRWDEDFEKSQKQLHELGAKAIDDFRAGKGRSKGFDEL